MKLKYKVYHVNTIIIFSSSLSNPTPVTDELITTKWQPLGKEKRNYLEINDNITSGENPDDQIWKLWKPLLKSLQ